MNDVLAQRGIPGISWRITAAHGLRWPHPIARTLAASVVASIAILASSAARADDAGISTPPEPPKAATSWYGYQTLSTDGIALALLAPAAFSKSSATQQGFGVGSLTMYGVGAPLVHMSHGNIGRGLADLAIRAGAPIVFGLIGAAIGGATYHQPSSCPASTCLDFGMGHAFAEIGGAVYGGMAGIGTAVAVDALGLAREPAKGRDFADEHAAPPPAPTTSKIEPAFGISPEGQARSTRARRSGGAPGDVLGDDQVVGIWKNSSVRARRLPWKSVPKCHGGRHTGDWHGAANERGPP